MKIKKITAALLALSLSRTAFAGCGRTTGSDNASTSGGDTSAAGGETAGEGGDDSSEAASEEGGSVQNTATENFAELYGEETIPLQFTARPQTIRASSQAGSARYSRTSSTVR